MGKDGLKVLLVGAAGLGSLERSYQRAFESIGCSTVLFDMPSTVNHYCRFGKLGQRLNQFVPVEPWIRKANRDLILAHFSEKPDLLLIFGQTLVRVGCLAAIRASSKAKIALVWQDPLYELPPGTSQALALYDIVATFSKSCCEVFRRLGAARVETIPLAADPELHAVKAFTPEELEPFNCDISFVGSWRPERAALLEHFAGLKVRVWGSSNWVRFTSKHSPVRQWWQGRPLFGQEMVKAVRASSINLNLLDATIPDSPNMRFFELLVIGGLQLCSTCSEMEQKFVHGRDVFYYRNHQEAGELARQILRDSAPYAAVGENGRRLVLQKHTYVHRAREILECMGL